MRRIRLGKYLWLTYSKNTKDKEEAFYGGVPLFLNLCRMKKYVDVIVPLPIASQYTYSLPSDLEESVQEGCRVVVSFGRKKFYTAIVTKVH